MTTTTKQKKQKANARQRRGLMLWRSAGAGMSCLGSWVRARETQQRVSFLFALR